MSCRVVIADDSEPLRLLARFVLDEHADIEVVGEAADGGQALDLVRDLAPDVLLLDLAMPVLDGLAVIDRLRERGSPVAIVVFSGFAPFRMGDEARVRGAHAYVEKGASCERLVQSIREASRRALDRDCVQGAA
jgi:DNA-binding NarL/FixJ family response regulator